MNNMENPDEKKNIFKRVDEWFETGVEILGVLLLVLGIIFALGVLVFAIFKWAFITVFN